MEVRNPRIRSLLRQAERTVAAGKRAAAQQLYEEIVAEAPGVAAGWLGLAETTRDPQVREQAYQQVLNLDPENQAALAALDGAGKPQVGLPATTPSAVLETKKDEEAPNADPFDQSRAWLDEATRRRQPDQEQAPETQLPASPSSPPTPTPTPEPKRVGAEPDLDSLPPAVDDLPVTGESTEDVLTCYRHPNRETGLRCYSCDRPICIKCAKRTPVGYRCPQCIREAEGVFFTANILDYLLAAIVSLILGVIAGYIVNFVGFFVIFIGPAAGSLIGRLAFRAARRHRGRWLPMLVGTAVAVGGLLPTALSLLPFLLTGQFNLGALGFGLIWPMVYVFLATGAAYYQVK